MQAIQPNPKVVFEILYDDPHLAIVSKPPGIVTEPGPKHPLDSLLNGLFVPWGNLLHRLGRDRSFGIVHRLDKPTSGALVVAKTIPVKEALDVAFFNRSIQKRYIAVIFGRPGKDRLLIDKPLIETRGDLMRVVVSEKGKPSRTDIQVLWSNGKYSLIEADLLTGRTHQIRVHLSAIGHPLMGDDLYGGGVPGKNRKETKQLNRFLLHAEGLRLRHPVTKEILAVRSRVPHRFVAFLRSIGLATPPEELLDKKGLFFSEKNFEG